MKCKSRCLVVLLVWYVMVATPAGLCAQNRYATDLLQRMAEKMSLRQKLDTLGDGCYVDVITYKSCPITVIVADGEVVHIGCTLFSDVQREGFGWVVCNFLERYSLEQSIPVNPDISAKERMRIDGVKVLQGSFDVSRIRALCRDTMLFMNVQTTPQGYTMGWRRGEEWVEAIAFPMEYDLLSGTDMDERERRLPENLQRHVPRQDTLPERLELKKAWQDNYYTLRGGTFLLPSLKADIYFEIDKEGALVPIYNKVYPIESLANLFASNLVDNEFQLEIRFRKYGLKTDTLRVPLRQWVSYCRATGCKAYFGIIELGKEKSTCELVMYNDTMGYNHIMRIDFPMQLLESRKGVITARLNSYVNTSRIKNLFDDNNLYKK